MPKIKSQKAKPKVQSGLTLPEYVKLLAKYEKAKKAADAKAEELKSLIHQVTTQHIPPLMEKLETDEFNSPGVGRVELRPEVHVNVLVGDKEALYRELRMAGHGDLIVEYIFPQTLKAFAKEQLEGNVALPSKMSAYIVPTAKLLKARKR